MEKSFEDILTSMLEEYDKSDGQNVDALIEEACKKQGVSEDGMALLHETNSYIDEFGRKAKELSEARENGKSREQWLQEELDKTMEGRSEEEKVKIVNAISETNERAINEMLNEN